MKGIELSYTRMFNSVRGTLIENKSIWENYSFMNSQVALLSNNIDLIDKLKSFNRSGTKGITAKKKGLRLKIEENGFVIKEALRMYYIVNSKTEEAKLLKYPKSVLTRKTDDSLYMTINKISEKADLLKTELGVFGITIEQITGLQLSLQKFYSNLPERSEFINLISEHVKRKTELINETRLLLRNLIDSMMLTYKQSHSDFYRSYKEARKREKISGRKNYYTVLINANVKDAETLLPLADVAAYAGKKKKECKTDANGNFQVKVYKKDADIITFKKEGYEMLELSIPNDFANNEIVVNVEMKKTLISY